MGLRTAEQYLDSLRDGREVYYDGERVVDIVAHPVLGQSARHFARAFTLQADPRYENLATVEEDGERVSRFFVPPRMVTSCASWASSWRRSPSKHRVPTFTW